MSNALGPITTPRYGLFFDVEKEACGYGERTLFLFNVSEDRVGNVAYMNSKDGPVFDENEPLFSVVEAKTIAHERKAQRIYLGARETTFDEYDVRPWVHTDYRITFETGDLNTARHIQGVFGGRVDVVWRAEGINFAIKVMRGDKMFFVQPFSLWAEDTEVSGRDLKAGVQKRVYPERGFAPVEGFDSGEDGRPIPQQYWNDIAQVHSDVWGFEDNPYETRRALSNACALGMFQPKSVLDAACYEGFGMQRIGVTLNAAHLTGFDVAEPSLARAKQRVPYLVTGVLNWTDAVNDPEKIRVMRERYGKFDCILVAEVLYLLGNDIGVWQAPVNDTGTKDQDDRDTILRAMMSFCNKAIVFQHAGDHNSSISRWLESRGAKLIEPEFGTWVLTVDNFHAW